MTVPVAAEPHDPIARAVDGEVMINQGGWFWPVSDITAWSHERQLAHLPEYARQIADARALAEQQRTAQ